MTIYLIVYDSTFSKIVAWLQTQQKDYQLPFIANAY